MGDKDISNKVLVVIAGPTGSGKTEVAIDVAKHFQSEIVSADSRQVYKELCIGVNRPTEDQLATVPHHLIGYTSIMDPYSAGHYTTDALNVIYALFARHEVVVLSGGTGLYLKSIIEGFDAMPEVPEEVTKRWTSIWEKSGLQPLLDALKELDPDYLAIVDQDNHSRLIRAVAVSDYTGRPFSSYRKGVRSDRFFRVVPVVLDVPRKDLYARLDQRVLQMMEQGWLKEVESIYPHRNLRALQTVGYTELFEVIDKKLTLEEAIPKIQQATRNYAKRQITWFRNQGKWNWIVPPGADEILKLIDLTRPLKE